MPNDEILTPADPADLATALAFALKFNGRKRIHLGDDLMAQLMAEHLIEYLEQSNFVVMRRPKRNHHFNPPSSL